MVSAFTEDQISLSPSTYAEALQSAREETRERRGSYQWGVVIVEVDEYTVRQAFDRVGPLVQSP